MLCRYSRCSLASVTRTCLVRVQWQKTKLYDAPWIDYWGALLFITQAKPDSYSYSSFQTLMVSLWDFESELSSWYVLIRGSSKLQAIISTSTLRMRNPRWYTQTCFSCFCPHQHCSYILWTCRGHCVLHKLTEHYSHLLRLGLGAWFNGLCA